jgi:hypothetical protein
VGIPGSETRRYHETRNARNQVQLVEGVFGSPVAGYVLGPNRHRFDNRADKEGVVYKMAV